MGLPFELPAANPIVSTFNKLLVTYHKFVDESVPHTKGRWISFGILISIFLLRIIFAQGWYIICYALGIYLLNLFLAFLTPKFDPSLEQELKTNLLKKVLKMNPMLILTIMIKMMNLDHLLEDYLNLNFGIMQLEQL